MAQSVPQNQFYFLDGLLKSKASVFCILSKDNLGQNISICQVQKMLDAGGIYPKDFNKYQIIKANVKSMAFYKYWVEKNDDFWAGMI